MTNADTIVRLHGLPRVPPPGGRGIIVTSERHDGGVGALLRDLVRQVRRLLGHSGSGTDEGVRPDFRSAEKEAEAKRAEIVRVFAEAKGRHAEAAKLETATDEIRREMAFARLERAMDVMTSLGVEAHLVPLPDGGVGIAVEGTDIPSSTPPRGSGVDAGTSQPAERA